MNAKTIAFFTVASFPSLMAFPNGSSSRIKGLLKGCQATGADLHVYWLRNLRATSDSAQSVQDMLLEKWGVKCTVFVYDLVWKPANFLSSFVVPLVTRISNQPEFPVISSESEKALTAQLALGGRTLVVTQQIYSLLIYRSLQLGYPLVCDYNDIEHRLYQRKILNPDEWGPTWLKKLQTSARRRLDCELIANTSVSLVCSKQDQEYLEKEFQLKNVVVIANCMPDVAAEAISYVGRDLVLFVGDMKYGPNANAIEHYVNDIYPLLKQQGFNEKLTVVGRGKEMLSERARACEGIILEGFVEDIAPYYQRAKLVVCPIRIGGGTRVKLVEAAAYGKAMLSTTVGCEGLEFENDKAMIVRDDPQEFANEMLALLSNSTYREKIAREARRVFTSIYTEQSQTVSIADLLAKTS